jgi:hypothetical protein
MNSSYQICHHINCTKTNKSNSRPTKKEAIFFVVTQQLTFFTAKYLALVFKHLSSCLERSLRKLGSLDTFFNRLASLFNVKIWK